MEISKGAQLEMQQQQAAQQAQYQQMLQQQSYMQQMQSQQAYAPQPLVPQPTSFGSNNPFASFAASSPPPMPSQPTQPLIDTSFNSSFNSSFKPSSPAPPPSASPANARPQRDDGQHAKLAALLGNREDGIDTFGNVGSMRIPVGSPFHPSNRLGAQATGQPSLQSQATGFGSMPGAPARGTYGAQGGQQQQQQQQQQTNPFFDL
jgi:epsin